jgi:predicted Rossmann fold flavoprotein
MDNTFDYNLIIVGSGAAGMMSAICAKKQGKKILLLEKLPKLGTKLKATGGGKCNLTNTLSNEEFMAGFGKNGRFMTPSLNALDQLALRNFFKEIGVESHAPDGVRVFPITHNSSTIINALEKEMQRLGVEVKCSQKVKKLEINNKKIVGVKTQNASYSCKNVIIATGGLGYPTLGAQGDGYELALNVGHMITSLHPAMMPLITKEKWVAECRADTISKATIRIDLKKAKKLKACGDIIFTKEGIRGPVVLDFAREITPLLDKYGEVPLLINLTKGMNEEQIRTHLKTHPQNSILESLSLILPQSISNEFCKLFNINPNDKFNKIAGQNRDELIKNLAWTPLTVIGHDGFEKAMITRGGVSLKEIYPDTLESKIIKGLYFCGEVVDLDGPCGGYNLQWSFSSGFLAGHLL